MRGGIAAAGVLTATLSILAPASSQMEEAVATVRVDATPGHVINAFDPDSALGSSIDVLSRREIDLVYTPHIIAESLSAGWGPITYRNNTELRAGCPGANVLAGPLRRLLGGAQPPQ